MDLRTKSEGEGRVCEFLCISVGMLAGVAVALYPSLLPSSGDSARDITIYNAATGEYALRVGLIWWALGMCLASATSLLYIACFVARCGWNRSMNTETSDPL